MRRPTAGVQPRDVSPPAITVMIGKSRCQAGTARSWDCGAAIPLPEKDIRIVDGGILGRFRRVFSDLLTPLRQAAGSAR